ncbi:hypothetical protein FOPG_13325 [Fusarium oxysporum f. sp. conglutinans race 2 54008]|uniref:Uncharacterized protein n=1 Tax=Fusarium oxysporum f. sp. conglutinans race 2 54008 TaxID=1089457 RepID=X0HGG0_FUSOX|nr:hypothetical protein FOPG_13325 [Fusarium oxysporum f. sp. conglutinans race 2 54008]
MQYVDSKGRSTDASILRPPRDCDIGRSAIGDSYNNAAPWLIPPKPPWHNVRHSQAIVYIEAGKPVRYRDNLILHADKFRNKSPTKLKSQGLVSTVF